VVSNHEWTELGALQRLWQRTLEAKKVAQVRLNGSEAELEEASRVLSMLSKRAMTSANPLTSLLVERVVKDELRRPDSPAVIALRRAVRDRFGDQVATQAVLQALEPINGPASEPDARPVDTQYASAELKAKVRRSRDVGSGIRLLVEAGLLPPDATIECRLYGVSHAARIRDGQIELNGRVYDSPSAAAGSLRAGKASNGWVIWKYKGELLSDLRARLAQHNASNSELA